MIFVTVGTHEQPFNRLIQKIDELKKDGIINEDVQQSDFTIHSTSEHLDKILMSDESCDYFYKIRIPQQIRKQLLVQLDAIGFHESSIYPDMEHIAREEANMYFGSQN